MRVAASHVKALWQGNDIWRQGLAARLVRSLIATIGARAETPFLHVLTTNQVAIERYLALGFVVRREMHLLVLDDARA